MKATVSNKLLRLPSPSSSAVLYRSKGTAFHDDHESPERGGKLDPVPTTVLNCRVREEVGLSVTCRQVQ